MFGSFWRIFQSGPDGVPIYLKFLHFRSEDADEPLKSLSNALAEESSKELQLLKLLKDQNWRAQLVGAIATALHGPSPTLVATLWNAIEEGSWVGPQLSVAVFLVDPQFESHAKERIEGIRNIAQKPPPREPELPTREHLAIMEEAVHHALSENPFSEIAQSARRHSEQGPDTDLEDLAKAIASLLALVAKTQPTWVREQLERDDIRRLLEYQDEDFGAFAIKWLEGFTDAAKRLGLAVQANRSKP